MYECFSHLDAIYAKGLRGFGKLWTTREIKKTSLKLWRKLFSQREHAPKGFVIGVDFCGQISDNKNTPSTEKIELG